AVPGRVQEDAAVEVDDLALHPRRLGRAEERDERRDLRRLSERPKGRRALDLLEERPATLLVAEVHRDGVGLDVARVHAVDGDAARAELDREVARERLEAGLGGGEDAVAGDVAVRVHARDGDDAAGRGHRGRDVLYDLEEGAERDRVGL